MNTASADGCEMYCAIVYTVVATFTVIMNSIATVSCSG